MIVSTSDEEKGEGHSHERQRDGEGYDHAVPQLPEVLGQGHLPVVGR